MRKLKDHVKCNVVSIRISNEEKAVLNEVTGRDSTSISDLVREAIQRYVPHLVAKSSEETDRLFRPAATESANLPQAQVQI